MCDGNILTHKYLHNFFSYLLNILDNELRLILLSNYAQAQTGELLDPNSEKAFQASK
jgi:hypothetical protein